MFFIILLIIANNVSNIGIASITIGAIKTTTVYVLATPTIAITAIINPINCAPTSPTKVLAGYLLNGKNPAVPPARAVIRNIDIIGEPFSINITISDNDDISTIPDESPIKTIYKIYCICNTNYPKKC